MVTALAVMTPQPNTSATLHVLSNTPGWAGYCAGLLRKLERLHPAI
jgi:hypothetical protein